MKKLRPGRNSRMGGTELMKLEGALTSLMKNLRWRISEMQQVVKAVYENGVFRPLNAPELSEGQEVQLIIHSKNRIEPNQILQLAAEVYQGFSDEQIHDVEQIALKRQDFFGEAVE